jgi:hypothetical protein
VVKRPPPFIDLAVALAQQLHRQWMGYRAIGAELANAGWTDGFAEREFAARGREVME